MSKIKVIPCSGIGKSFGLMAREAALKVTDDLCKDTAETACLAHIVMGDAQAKAGLAGCACITVDGCPALCAAKSVEAAGGNVVERYRVVDEMKNHRGKNTGTATALSIDGWQITDELAEKIADKVNSLNQNGGQTI